MPDSILLHVCCGPCSLMPVLQLQAAGYAVTGYFANANIHPLKEYLRRREAMQSCAQTLNIPVMWQDDIWDIAVWMREAQRQEAMGVSRCAWCYASRFNLTAAYAKSNSFMGFTSTLLYSRQQNHALIHTIGEQAAVKHGVSFVYVDFRVHWQQGIDIAKKLAIYRQPYCGCIFSEAERYAKKWKKLCTTA